MIHLGASTPLEIYVDPEFLEASRLKHNFFFLFLSSKDFYPITDDDTASILTTLIAKDLKKKKNAVFKEKKENA